EGSYARDKKSKEADMEDANEEIRRIKEEEGQAMREALCSTAEDLGAGHAEVAHVPGLGFAKAPKAWEESRSLPATMTMDVPKNTNVSASPSARDAKEDSEDERRKKRRREEKKQEKYERQEERKHERREKRHARDSDDKRHKRDKGKRRHDSD
ncbi:multiple myeloma tumor-associated protein 2, partial [Tanacetum coccineum]